MRRTQRTRDWARANSGVFALLPWHGGRRDEWEEYAYTVLSGCADWATRGRHFSRNLAYLRILGRVFDEYAGTGSLREETETKFQAILANIYPTYQAAGKGRGIGWNVTQASDILRRVGQLAGRLWEAIARGAVGIRLQRCRGCGLVQYRLRTPRPDDYACSKACQELRRGLRRAGSDLPGTTRGEPYAPGLYVWMRPGCISRIWPRTEVSASPTAGTAEHPKIDVPRDATSEDEGKGPPADRGSESPQPR